MSVGTQGLFRLLHYDFKPWHLWILPIPAEVLVSAAVYGRMYQCNLWFSVVMAQCLYLSGSGSNVARTCLISFRRQGVSHSYLNVIHSGICCSIWWWLVLETLQWMCWEALLAQDESFSLLCAAQHWVIWKSFMLWPFGSWNAWGMAVIEKNSISCLKLCEAYFYFNCVLITTG